MQADPVGSDQYSATQSSWGLCQLAHGGLALKIVVCRNALSADWSMLLVWLRSGDKATEITGNKRAIGYADEFEIKVSDKVVMERCKKRRF